MCFAVSITGTGIPEGTGNCQPTLGATAGFVEAGQSVEIEVKSGESRKIELYLHLKAAGDTSACPGIGGSISTPNVLTSTYLVGTVNNISLVEEEVSVSIPVSFPGESSHIAQTMGLPASCTTGATVVTGGPKMLGSSGGTVTNASHTLKANIGAFIGGTEATGGTYKLRIQSQ